MCIGLKEQVVLLQQQLEMQQKAHFTQASKYETIINELKFKLKGAERGVRRHNISLHSKMEFKGNLYIEMNIFTLHACMYV
jgi:hypothetical protein